VAVRILHSFPHKIGASRICTTAWWEVASVADAGGDVTLYAGAVQRPLPAGVRTRTTLARGRWRIPYRVLGTRRALALHDRLVARALPGLRGRVDVVHTWPLAGQETLRTARRLGIATVVERPNAHTRFAMEAVARECERLGVVLPPGQEHAYDPGKLRQEEAEYDLADYLLCPSEFVARTFREAGFAPERLLRHGYGYDDRVYFPAAGHGVPAAGGRDGRGAGLDACDGGSGGLDARERGSGGLDALFVGVCAVRKGLHFALEAWLRSPASETGTFRIAGEFIPGYEERLAELLAHPSVHVLGHRDDVPELMRRSDVLMLPTIEEGSPLVCMEAVGSGCVPLVSEVCDAVCVEENALVHRVGDVDALAGQLTLLHEDRDRLDELREACLRVAPTLTWAAAGRQLLGAYERAAAPGGFERKKASARPVLSGECVNRAHTHTVAGSGSA
jgi:glycosyltransferase involved in cell wall biosynthesis